MITRPATDPLPAGSTEFAGCTIDFMEVFRFDCEETLLHIPGYRGDGNCRLLRICANGKDGWAQTILPARHRHFDLVQWAAVFMNLKGLGIRDAFRYIRCNGETWGTERSTLADAALRNLQARLHDPLRTRPDESRFHERWHVMGCSESYFSF